MIYRDPDAWPRVAGYIADAMARFDTGFALKDVGELVAAGDVDLWVIGDAGAAITQIIDYPMHKVLYIWMYGGAPIDPWLPKFIGAVEEYALEMGCKYVDNGGRPGWSRPMKNLGYATAMSGRKRINYA